MGEGKESVRAFLALSSVLLASCGSIEIQPETLVDHFAFYASITIEGNEPPKFKISLGSPFDSPERAEWKQENPDWWWRAQAGSPNWYAGHVSQPINESIPTQIPFRNFHDPRPCLKDCLQDCLEEKPRTITDQGTK
jgi:hypothetical protein